MAKALTNLSIDRARPKATRYELPDGKAPGLYLAVFPSGAKSWVYRYRTPLSGKPAKLTIGPYPDISLESARDKQAEARTAIALEKDPAAEKKARKALARIAVVKFGDDATEFLKVMKKTWRPRWYANVNSIFNKHILPAWRDRPTGAIETDDVVRLVDKVAAVSGDVAANRTLSLVHRFYSWHHKRAGVTKRANPAADIDKREERARDRRLSDSEIRDLWNATGGPDPFHKVVRLLLVTAQRRNEVAGMSISELNVGAATWILPAVRSKNGVEHLVPLSKLAVDIIRSVSRRAHRKFLFTTNGKRPISGFSKSKRRLDEALKFKTPWVLHDLRRTAATGMQQLRVPPVVVAAVTNHVAGARLRGAPRIYQLYQYEPEKRAALDAWAAELERIVRPQ